MPSLILTIFLVQLTIHLLNTAGSAVINELLWTLYNKLPTPTSMNVKTINIQRREVLRLKREMQATSAQDEFSRWAKLRRQHDKANAEYEKNAAGIKSSRTQFDTLASTLRWLGTNGLRFLLQFWFASQPVFWIPGGWMPYYIEWILSFPKAPLGSVSVQVWWVACASCILLVQDAAVAGWKLGRRESVDQQGVRADGKKKMAFESGSSGDDGGEKKEL